MTLNLPREWRIASSVIGLSLTSAAFLILPGQRWTAVVVLALSAFSAITSLHFFCRMARIFQQRADRLDALRALETKIQAMKGDAHPHWRQDPPHTIEWRH
jgi:hypothetical protein